MQPPVKSLALNFDKRKENFVASKIFCLFIFVSGFKKKLMGFYNAVIPTCHLFVQRLKPWGGQWRPATLKQQSAFLIWFSTARFNGLSVKQAALAMKREKGWELNSFAAVWVAERPFVLSYPQTWQHLSGVWYSPHQTKHKDLLLYCYSTVKDSWLHPHNPQKPTRRGNGKVFLLRVGLEGDARNQRGFVGYWSTVATTTFTFQFSPTFSF